MSFGRTLIDGLLYLTSPPDSSDMRLKVLWFEDKMPITVSLKLHPFLQVTRVMVPDAAEVLLRAQRSTVLSTQHANEYALPECPHDVYLADFKLAEADRNIVGELSLAARAEAAGLTASVLMAMNFPSHPATVIPYTAYDDQLKAQRDLIKRFCPHFVNVQWGDELGKLSAGVGEVLNQAVRVHREYLPRAAGTGLLYLPGEVRTKLNELVHQCGQQGQMWHHETTISFETLWGTRLVYLSSFWPELVVQGDTLSIEQADEVVKWIEKFPVPSPKEVAAADLAYTYFCQRISFRSVVRYQLAAWLRDGFGPNDRQEVEFICDHVGLEKEPVQKYAEACDALNQLRREIDREKRSLQKAPGQKGKGNATLKELETRLEFQKRQKDQLEESISIPGSWHWPHLLKLDKKVVDDETKRLAVLFLLVYEELRRWTFSLLAGEQMPQKAKDQIKKWLAASPYSSEDCVNELIQAVRAKMKTLRNEEAGDPMQRTTPESVKSLMMALRPLADALEQETDEQDEEILTWFFGSLDQETRELWHAMEPVTESSVAQLIDPLPEQLNTADVDFAAGRIKAALKRLGLDVGKLLGSRHSEELSPAERRAIERFAGSLKFPRRAWPSWMKWPGIAGADDTRNVPAAAVTP